MQPVATSEPKVGVANRIWQRLRRGRIYYWPIRTLVQLAFFLLFAGIALARLNPSFNGARSWVILPVVASVKAQGAIGSTLDATTLLLSQADRKSTRLNSSHVRISYAVFCLKK